MSVTELTYQKASAEDAPVIFSFSKALIDTYEDLSNIDYNKVLKWVEWKIHENIHHYTCVMLGKEKVGYFNLQQGTEEAELDDFYVLPEYRRKGIGTMVLSYCIAQADTPIFLYVFRKNTDAIRLYARFGFSVSEEIGNTRLILRREIDNNSHTVNKQKEL